MGLEGAGVVIVVVVVVDGTAWVVVVLAVVLVVVVDGTVWVVVVVTRRFGRQTEMSG